MLCEIVGGHEGQDMGFQTFQAVIVKGLECRVLDSPVHPLGLPIGPRMIRLGEAVLDGEFSAGAIEGVFGKSAKAIPLSVSTV